MIFMIGSNGYGQTDSDKLLASCCFERGRCTGSAYCTACKNCSRCKHCSKNGGSCGVCSSGSREKSSLRRKSKTKPLSKSFDDKVLYVSVALLNLREGAGTNFPIVEKLSKDAKLLYLGKEKLWIKVKVEKSNTIGYVYYKYLR